MNSLQEPAPYQRHEWNTFMCLLWHSAHVPLPSEPNPYQTQTTRPRSAPQLALRDVRSTECMFYEVIQGVGNWHAGWGQNAGLFEVHSWPWHCCWLWVKWVTGKQQANTREPTRRVSLHHQWLFTGSETDYSWQPRRLFSVNYRLLVFISFCFYNCESMHVRVHRLDEVKCVGRWWLSVYAEILPEQLHLYTDTWGPRQLLYCIFLAPVILSASVSTCLLFNVPNFFPLFYTSIFQLPCPLTCHSVLIVQLNICLSSCRLLPWHEILSDPSYGCGSCVLGHLKVKPFYSECVMCIVNSLIELFNAPWQKGQVRAGSISYH